MKTVATIKPKEGSILLIVCEPILRDLLSRTLRTQGYTIEASSVGSDGIRKFEKRKAKISLAMIDSSLPDVSGLDLAKRIKGINGSTPIILIKGRGRNLGPGELEKCGVDFIVTKPFHMDDTLNLVERAMIHLQDSDKSGGG